MNYTPKISVITSVYNGGKYLEDCIRSILGQTWPDVEYIIIDGGSTDGSAELIRKYEERLHYWVSERDKGIYNAWNKGLARATGEWICFVGSDDILWDNHVLENTIGDLYEAFYNRNSRFVYGKNYLLSDQSELLKEWGEPWEISKKSIFQYMSVTHCGAFHHRSLFAEHGNFNEDFRITGDYELLLRELVKGKDAFFINRVIAGMHAGGVSASLRSKLTMARELRNARRINGLPASFHSNMQVTKARIANILVYLLGEKAIRKLADVYRMATGKEKIWSKMDN
jgi:glycosyltransferase involved in cell wall biosynthesis